MFPRPFDYAAPRTLSEAVSILAAADNAKVLAGGMSLIPMMKLRVLFPAVLIDLGRIPGLDRITAHESISLPALVRHRQVAMHAAIARGAAALADAAAGTGDPHVRARGTTCGVVAHADPAGDQSAALLALDGRVVARSLGTTRLIPIRELFVDAFATNLRRDEIIERIELPLPGPGEGSAYVKVGRRGTPSGFAIAGVAAWVRIENGTITDSRIALSGVSFRPVASSAGAQLAGSRPTARAIAAAAATAAEGIPIVGDLHGSATYKAHLVTVLARRALRGALERAASGR